LSQFLEFIRLTEYQQQLSGAPSLLAEKGLGDEFFSTSGGSLKLSNVNFQLYRILLCEENQITVGSASCRQMKMSRGSLPDSENFNPHPTSSRQVGISLVVPLIKPSDIYKPGSQ